MTAQPPSTHERRIRVLWNPTAGRKGGVPTNRSSRTMLLELMSRHDLGDELIEPGSEQEAVEAARDAADRGYDVVVAAGGDGTIGLVGRQLMGTRTALGILPLGSVMNIPRMLGLPRDPEGAAQILADGHVRSIDVGQVGDRIFYEAGSVGMHAAATRELPLVDRGDYGAIVRSIVAAFRYRPSEVRIELDGDRTISARAVGIAVANGPFMGPGVAVAPEALLDDGLFDVRVFLHYTKAELLRYVSSIVRGRRPRERRSLIERASWVRITSGRPLAARADAMDLGSTPVVFEIRPRVLTVVAPDPSASSSGSMRHGPHLPSPAAALRPRPPSHYVLRNRSASCRAP
jgi:diacylglycerol kinase (ATP)